MSAQFVQFEAPDGHHVNFNTTDKNGVNNYSFESKAEASAFFDGANAACQRVWGVPCGEPDCDGECARCLEIKRIRAVPFGKEWRAA
jgi:hypothetical protein